MGNRYVFDKRTLGLKKATYSFGRVVGTIIRLLLYSMALAMVIYTVFALIFSTNEEKKLALENRLYEERYSEMVGKQRQLGTIVSGLRIRDDAIYGALFSTDAPDLEPLTAVDMIAESDSLSDSFFLSYSESKGENLMRMALRVEDNFRALFTTIEEKGGKMPPMKLPIEDITPSRTGASVGPKRSPFLGVEVDHGGVDLIAPQGTPVYASASGTVSEVIRSKKGQGNVVVIDHGNGWKTRYSFLADITVSRGRPVKAGAAIGSVGISLGAFAPHLHYEVHHNGEVQDPVNYFFASVSPADYASMLYMAVSTGQSLD